MAGEFGNSAASHADDSSAGLAARRAARRARQTWQWAALGVFGALSCALFFGFDALPFMDLPAHAGLFALRHRFLGSPFDQSYYVYAPHLGAYSVFRFLGEVLSRVARPLTAVRCLGAAAMVSLPVAMVDARRRLYGSASPGFGFLGFVLGFSLMALFGFASYLLGVALLVECTALWLAGQAAPFGPAATELRRALPLALLATLLFLTHGFAFILFLAIVAVVTIDRTRVRGWASMRESLPRLSLLVPAAFVAACAAWTERASSLPPGAVPVPQPRSGLLFQGPADKLSLLLSPTLMTRTGVDAGLCVVVWIIVIAGVVSALRWLDASRDRTDLSAQHGHVRALFAASIVLCGAFFLMPHEIGWFGFVDGRLLPVVLVLGALSVPPSAMGPRLEFAYQRLLPAIAGILLGLSFFASRQFQREAAGYREIFTRIPPFARVLNMPLDADSDIFTGHPFVHFDKLMLIEKTVLLSDVWLHQGSALFPRAGNPILRLPTNYVSSDLRSLDWSRFRLSEWDYVLVRVKPAAAPPAVPSSLMLVRGVGGWWLFKTSQFGFSR